MVSVREMEEVGKGKLLECNRVKTYRSKADEYLTERSIEKKVLTSPARYFCLLRILS